jgi:multiple antibiotic resistance protein
MANPQVYLKVFIAIYVLVNPLEGIPVFLARTQSMASADRRIVARVAAIGVTVILLATLFAGRGILSLLGIGVGAFATAGGIIIFLVALKMIAGDISARPPEQGEDIAASAKRFALVPLAMPLLAGPGVICSVIVYATKGPTDQGCTLLDYVILSIIIVAVGLATWAALRAADPLRRLLGETGIEVSTRISGILIAAIAVELFHEGIVRLFPALVH